jgi:hypothetical protein
MAVSKNFPCLNTLSFISNNLFYLIVNIFEMAEEVKDGEKKLVKLTTLR